MRLWVLVAVVLLLLPVVIVMVRGGGPSAAAPAHPASPDEAPPAEPGEQTPRSAGDGTAAPQPSASAEPTNEQTTAPTTERADEPTNEPATAKVPEKGPQKYRTATGRQKPASSRGRLIRYQVKVERNLSLDENAVARTIEGTLNDSRSWTGDNSVRFALAGTGKAELTVYVVTPGTTDKLCAPLRTFGDVSCQQGNRVVLNAKRWITGVSYYGDDLTNYRRYMVNHEVGHYLGRGHVQCPGKGRRAPIMMQQTKGLDGCRANPWVDPARS